jgi:hypothetical protein
MESMNNWFNDKDHPENMEKKKYLKEIFKIAKQQERYKSGQIGALTVDDVQYKFISLRLNRWNCFLQRHVWRQACRRF